MSRRREKISPMSLEKWGKREADIFTVDDNIQWRDTEFGDQSIWSVGAPFLLGGRGV